MKKFAVVLMTNQNPNTGTAYVSETAGGGNSVAATQADALRKQGYQIELGLFELTQVGTIPPTVLVDWKTAS